jgi:GNAT superfamily N-acetyltransferase
VLEQVFSGLSAQSRYQRFHGPKPRLSSRELAYLAAVDDRNHLAVVALGPGGTPLGIARAVRLGDDPTTAEIAAEVVDAAQRAGIGTAMIARLARRASGAGIRRLTASVLAETGLQVGLIRLGWRVVNTDGPSITLAIDAWKLAGTGRGADATPPAASPAPAALAAAGR